MGKCEWKPAFPQGEVCFLIVSLPLCTPLYCQIPPEKTLCLALRRQENMRANGQRLGTALGNSITLPNPLSPSSRLQSRSLPDDRCLLGRDNAI